METCALLEEETAQLPKLVQVMHKHSLCWSFSQQCQVLPCFCLLQTTTTFLEKLSCNLLPQIDEPERGFSFLRDGPLDMRMNPGVSTVATVQPRFAYRNSLA